MSGNATEPRSAAITEDAKLKVSPRTNATQPLVQSPVRPSPHLQAALVADVVLLGVTLLGYTALHCIHPQWFYKNHFKRGFGPEPPATAGASGAWAWVVLVARMPLDEIERHAGSDARVLLEFIALAMKILTAYALMGTLQLAAYLVASYQAVAACISHIDSTSSTQLKMVWLCISERGLGALHTGQHNAPLDSQMYPDGLQHADGSDRGNLPRTNCALLQAVTSCSSSVNHALYSPRREPYPYRPSLSLTNPSRIRNPNPNLVIA